jgi:hypothetical protein
MSHDSKTLDHLEEKISEVTNKNHLDKKSDKYALERIRTELKKELSDKADLSNIQQIDAKLDELIGLMQDIISELRKLDNKQRSTEIISGFIKKRIADLEEKTFGKRLDVYISD